MSPTSAPSSHHLDRRAGELVKASSTGEPDDLLNTKQTAAMLGLSPQFLEIGRSRGYGPKFVRLSTRRIRYRRAAIIEWLRSREHQSTEEYRAKEAV